MGGADILEQVRQTAARVASSYGLEIFDVQYRREGQGMMLRVLIDRPGSAGNAGESVSVDDCAAERMNPHSVLGWRIGRVPGNDRGASA